MPNNNELSKLISESYDRELQDSEKELLEKELQTNSELQEFKAFLSRLRKVTLGLSAEGVESSMSSKGQLSDEKREALEALIARAKTDDSVAKDDSHQIEDVALASLLISHGAISSEQLGTVVQDWSAYGNISLHDHLAENQAIDAEELARFKKLAADTVRDQSGTDTVRTETGEFQRSVAHILGINQANPDLKINTQIDGKYTIIRKLGGGLGSVYLAKDNSLDRTVAIKTIAQDDQDKQSALTRFTREAKVTGRLEHPNIVSIYQFGEDKTTGDLYYSMRYVGKRTLHDAILEYHHRKAVNTTRKSDFQKLISAFLTVCQAIGYAHSKGVIHRDLKPQNVAIDDFGQITVIDWGLAKLVDEKEISGETLGTSREYVSESTNAGQVLGTPFYMSPEQASGRIDSIDERTDVYGLGAILFEIITGRPPHAQHVVEPHASLKMTELLTSIVSSESPVIPPDTGVDPVLADICERAISKSSFGRYSSSLELYDAVQDWLDNIESRLKQKERCKSEVRNIESKLTMLCEDIDRSLRFVSVLPPVQGIVDASLNRPQSEPLEVWRKRLETIIEGLLRTNRDVVSISFVGIGEDQSSATEICTVQRHPNDPTFITVVPTSRLLEHHLEQSFPGILLAEPGDSLFEITQQYRSKAGTGESFLQATLPTFDDGELFGFITITCKMDSVLDLECDPTIANDAIHLTVVDADGNIVASNCPGSLVREVLNSPTFKNFQAQHTDSVFENDRLHAKRFERTSAVGPNLTIYIIASGNVTS